MTHNLEPSTDLTPGDTWTHAQLAVVRDLTARTHRAERERDQARAALDRVRALADTWDSDENTRWYYDNRHSHPNGIDYVAGYSDRWEEDATALRATLNGTP
jgi:hypothetical protein